MEWIISGLTIVAFFSLMYGVICIDTYFQNNHSEYKFLTSRRQFTLETVKAFDKELSK